MTVAHVLLVTEDSTHSRAVAVGALIEGLGHTVAVTNDDATSLAAVSTVGVDVIAALRNSDDAALFEWVSDRWVEGLPLLLGYTTLGTVPRAVGVSGANATSTIKNMEVVNGPHPAQGGESGTVPIYSNWTSVKYSTDAANFAGSILGVDASATSRGVYSAVDASDVLYSGAGATHLPPGGVAPERAVFAGWLGSGATYELGVGPLVSAAIGWLADSAPIQPELSLAGSIAAPAGAFTLEAVAPAADVEIELAGTVDAPAASFDVDASAGAALVNLAGVIGAPDATLTFTAPYFADTTNRVGGRARDGIGIASWEPAVEEPPVPSSETPRTHNVVRAHAYAAPVFTNGTMPELDVSELVRLDHRTRIVVGGKDISFFRGIVTPLPAYQLTEPLLWGAATLELPQVNAALERPGVGALKWLRPGAAVKVQRVNQETGEVVSTDYRGIVIAFDHRGKNLSVEIGGHASGRAALRNKQLPIVVNRVDLGRHAWTDLRRLGLQMKPRTGPDTGIYALTWGGGSYLDHLLEVCARAVTKTGKQWSVMPNDDGIYRMQEKDTTTIHGTVYLDDARCVGDLRRDMAEEPNRVYATGITPDGLRVKFGSYPGLLKSRPAPYPMADGSTFGEGTTDADTDTGDGISAMTWRLVAMGYLTTLDREGGYDADVTDAVATLQADADLPSTGVMNEKTWAALYDLDVTGWSLTSSTILPAAQKSYTRKWRRSASGSVIERNPNYDPSALIVDHNVSMGQGFTRAQIKRWARQQLSNDFGDHYAGTITFHTGAIPAGEHTPGDPVEVLRRSRSIKPGMNLSLPLFSGGIVAHVSAVSVTPDGTVTAVVDTRARDAMQVWEVIQRNRESRNNPARVFLAQHRSSAISKDQIVTFDEVGGMIDDRIKLDGGKWNVFPVVAAQAGTIAKLRLDLGEGVEYAVAVFGKQIRRKRLAQAVAAPLTEAGSKRWSNPTVRGNLDADHLLLYVAGDHEQPCGYFPKMKGDDGATKTGRWEDDAGFGYATFRAPVLYVAIWPNKDCSVKPGRVMWPQLEEGT